MEITPELNYNFTEHTVQVVMRQIFFFVIGFVWQCALQCKKFIDTGTYTLYQELDKHLGIETFKG